MRFIYAQGLTALFAGLIVWICSSNLFAQHFAPPAAGALSPGDQSSLPGAGATNASDTTLEPVVLTDPYIAIGVNE
jgi:hypothetical protein